MASSGGKLESPPKSGREESEATDLHNYATGDGIKVTAVDTILEKDKEDESLQRYKKALLGEAADGDVGAGDGSDKRAVIIDALILKHPQEPGGRHIYIPLTTEEDVEAAKKMNPIVKEGAVYTYEVRFRIHRGIVSGLQLSNKVYGSLGVELDRDEVVLGSFAPKVAHEGGHGKPEDGAGGGGGAAAGGGGEGGSRASEASPGEAAAKPGGEPGLESEGGKADGSAKKEGDSTSSGAGKELGPDGLPKPRPDQYVFQCGELDQYPSGMLGRGQYSARCKFKDDDGNVHLRMEYRF